MSIWDLINSHLGKELFCLFSEFESDETPRTVFVSREVADLVLGDWDDSPLGTRHARAKAVLDDFLVGGFVTIAENPFDKSTTAMLARVAPVEDEIFQFRCLDPVPGIRILGCFSELDTFVALTWDYRENFGDEWPERVNECRAKWKELFGDTPPFKGKNLNEYVSYNFKAV
jgi:hypothetical protein